MRKPLTDFPEEIFRTEEEFQHIYEEFLRKEFRAPGNVMDSYRGMCDAFEDYLCAIEENTFRHAYQYGYEAGRKAGEMKVLSAGPRIAASSGLTHKRRR